MTEKSRKTALTIIAAVLSLVTVWIAAGYCSVSTLPLLNTDNMGDILIDGSNWTSLFKMGVDMVNGVIRAAFIVLMLAAELILMPVTWGIFRYNAFKTNTTVSKEEFSYSWKVFLISTFGALAVSVVFMIVWAVRAKSGAPFSAILFCWLNPLFMWVLYISKLKKLSA